jgi:hypothetical protein
MNTEINDLPTVSEELIEIFDMYGTSTPPDVGRVEPIIGGEKKAKAGKEGNINKKPVGYTAYSSYFNSLVYLVEKRQRDIIYKVEGGGFAISKSIIEELQENNVKYVFGGMTEKNTILIFPLDAFDTEFHTQGWDKQLYATKDKDVIYEIPNGVSDVFSDYPSNADNAITMEKALNKINRN